MSRGRLWTWLAAAGVMGFSLFPLVYAFLVALNRHPDFLSARQEMIFTWDHFNAVMTNPFLHFWDYLVNSLLVSGLTALLCLLLAAPAAYALTRLEIRYKLAVLLGILGLSMFPPVSLVGFLFKLLSAWGLINTKAGLILPYAAWTLPLALWILVSYFKEIPPELDRAALVDGCTPFQVLVKVILPLAGPGLFSTGLLAFIFAFNEFLLALILTTDHQARTIPVGLALFQGLHGQTPWGEIMAATILALTPVALLAAVFQRRIVRGLTGGAVKG